MSKVKTWLGSLVLVVILAYGVVFTGASITDYNQPGGAVAASAAKELDAATTAGGPTAQQNQKIQELTFNQSYVVALFGNGDAFEADNKKKQEQA